MEGMANNEDQPMTMFDYARPSLTGTESSIVRPDVQGNFEIKPNVIQMVQQFVQFDGLQDGDPNAHIANFLEICDTFKIDGATDDAIRLRLFPFSLRSRAKQWLNSLPRGSITSWEAMAEKFLAKYFPPAKTAKMRNDISSFYQLESETLYDTWERFKELLRKCPHHGIPDWLQVQTFYNGLNTATRQMIDAAAGGTLNSKTPRAAQELFEEMAMNNYQWSSTRSKPAKSAGIYSLDAVTSLAMQVEALGKKIDGLSVNHQVAPVMRCDICGGGHPNHECRATQKEYANVIGNIPPYQNYNGMNNPGWRNYANQPWNNNQQPMQNNTLPGFQQASHPPPPPAEKKSNLEELLSERPQGSLPNNTETNPREQVNAVTLRSGRTLQEKGKQETEKDAVEEEDKCQEENVEKPPVVKEFIPPLPYPARLKKDRDNEQFGKFLSLFRQLHINLPFVNALAQMPKYAKFLKDLLSNKKKLEELATVTLNEECSAILQNKMPEKLKDPGSFNLPCLIGRLIVDRALADLGASINLMPYSVFKKLGLGEPRPTRMSIQLADRSIKYPRGIIEDVLVKVDKFIFPVDFVILDMDEDTNVPLILGRPFLATTGAIIDVRDGKLILREFLISNPLERSLVHDRGKDDMSLVTQEQWCHLEATKPLWRKRDFKVLE
ncbi:uncharacterized protein LOC113848267 [Abrus precatorius]|uniref:Uncharacterized protein LOC113848267 n=1 Tax=Abrus precatorius TaxID=3816 RepID=A0A8B8JSJ6_ABRPR|nr:uncharacterized protein LOC113848267 [Abrus precatorius]